jgi:PAS domain S-box-containing protein
MVMEIQRETMYKTFFEKSRDAIVIVSPDGRYIDINQSYLDLFGYSREELIRKNVIVTYVDPQDRNRFHKEVEQKGFVKDYECRYRRKDGKIIDCVSTTAVWRDENEHILGYWGIIRDVTEKKSVDRKIQNYQKKLRALSSKLLLAEERERRRIARDLHDSIGQVLSLCLTRLIEFQRQLPSHIETAALDDSIRLLEQGSKEVQSLIFEISPPILYDLGFVPAVEWLAEKLQCQNSFRVHLVNQKNFHLADDEIRILLFQIVRELMVNVSKHARAENVTVSLTRSRNTVSVSVEDDGVGFAMHPFSSQTYKNGGFGLFSIHDRIDNLNGSMHIDSKPGRGTKVELTIPVKPE